MRLCPENYLQSTRICKNLLLRRHNGLESANVAFNCKSNPEESWFKPCFADDGQQVWLRVGERFADVTAAGRVGHVGDGRGSGRAGSVRAQCILLTGHGSCTAMRSVAASSPAAESVCNLQKQTNRLTVWSMCHLLDSLFVSPPVQFGSQFLDI